MSDTSTETSLVRDIEQSLASMQRRSFLVRSAQLALVASAGSLVGCAQSSDKFVGLKAGKALSLEQMAFFRFLSQVLLPTSGTSLTALDDVPVLENLDNLFASMPQKVQSDLGAAMQLFEYGGLVMGWRFSRFTKMPQEEAISYIDSWQSGYSMQQGIVTVLKKLVYASYWREESTWGPVHFDGPVSVRWGLQSLGEAPLPTRTPA